MAVIAEKKIGYLAGIMGLLVPIVVGTLWIGSVSNTASSAQTDVKELKTNLKDVPADVAVLKSQMAAMSAEQRAQYEALLAAIHENHR